MKQIDDARRQLDEQAEGTFVGEATKMNNEVENMLEGNRFLFDMLGKETSISETVNTAKNNVDKIVVNNKVEIDQFIGDTKTYAQVKRAIVSHTKFTKVGDKYIEITPELKDKYKKQGKKAPKEVKSKRVPTGPLYQTLVEVSKIYGVNPMKIIKEQDLTQKERYSIQEVIRKTTPQHIATIPRGKIVVVILLL